jgi:hypothetical protein
MLLLKLHVVLNQFARIMIEPRRDPVAHSTNLIDRILSSLIHLLLRMFQRRYESWNEKPQDPIDPSYVIELVRIREVPTVPRREEIAA